MSMEKMKIYNTIRLLRQHKGFSQEYLAEKIGVDVATYGRVESGKIKLTVERLADIAKALDYSSGWIVNFSEFLPDNENRNLIDLINKNIALSELILNKINNLK